MEKRERKRRGNSRYVLFFIIALLILSALAAGSYSALMKAPWFNLKTITVKNNVSIPASMISSLASKYLEMNLLAVPVSDLKRQILSISRVKSVKITRKLMHTLVIDICERQGFVYVKSLEGDLYPIDQEGRVLEKLTAYYNEDLPILNTYLGNNQLIRGKKLDKPYVKRVLALHQSITANLPDFAAQVSEYYLVDDTIYMVDAKYGTRLIPSEDELIKQLTRYQFVQDNGNIDKNTVIDLRFKNQVVVKAGK